MIKLTKQQKKEAHEKKMTEIETHTLDDFLNDDITLLHGDCLEKMKQIGS